MPQESLEVESFGGNVYRVRATIANRGALPTHVTNKGKELGRFQTVLASLRPAEGVMLLSSEGITPSRLLRSVCRFLDCDRSSCCGTNHESSDIGVCTNDT